ncbi:MAG: hypothetical protein QXT26_02690 [Thermoproteota archaeon]
MAELLGLESITEEIERIRGRIRYRLWKLRERVREIRERLTGETSVKLRK